MFYYISFLRPPPLQASADSPVLVTPQISNDLRTEYLDDPVDIYYAWSRPPVITQPAKLTSWRAHTAYKAIPVPRPPRLDAPADDAPSWRLVLSCGATRGDQTILLGDPDTTGRRAPFAVTSMPIARSYALRVSLQDPPVVFELTEHTSFDLDKKVWDSGIGLASWLVRLFSRASPNTVSENDDGTLSDLRNALFGTDAPRHVLELGAGTGIVAITLAVLRATTTTTNAGSIVATDLPSAMPILQDNIAANHALMHDSAPQPAVLDWDAAEDLAAPPPVQAQLDAGLDVIVMADVTYNTASFPALVDTLARLIAHSTTHPARRRPPRVLMGYKERHPDERALWDRARAIGLSFRQIARVDGAGGRPVEIWLA